MAPWAPDSSFTHNSVAFLRSVISLAETLLKSPQTITPACQGPKVSELTVCNFWSCDAHLLEESSVETEHVFVDHVCRVAQTQFHKKRKRRKTKRHKMY